MYDHLYCSIIDFEENERWLPREDGQGMFFPLFGIP